MTAIFKYIVILPLRSHFIEFTFSLNYFIVKQLLGISFHSSNYIFCDRGVGSKDKVFEFFCFSFLLALVRLNSCHAFHACVTWIRFSICADILRTAFLTFLPCYLTIDCFSFFQAPVEGFSLWSIYVCYCCSME